MTSSTSYHSSAICQISHELRTPVTSIMGMTYFLNQTSLTPEQKEYIEFIETSADQLLSLEKKLHNLIKKSAKHANN